MIEKQTFTNNFRYVLRLDKINGIDFKENTC